MNGRRIYPAVLASVLAACAQPGGIEVSDLTLGNAPPDAPMRAGYLTITNRGPGPRTLVGARSARFGTVEFHHTQTVDGVARMRQEKALSIAAGEALVFAPMGRHLMLMQPRAGQTDEPLTIDLCFADGECVTARARGNGQ